MAGIYHALARVKQDLSKHLPESSILQAAGDAGHKWRKRILDPVITVQRFVLQVLRFNTALTHVRSSGGPDDVNTPRGEVRKGIERKEPAAQLAS